MLEFSLLYANLQERQSKGEEISMQEIEIRFCESVFATGRLALSRYLSNIPEKPPLCSKCNEPMRNLGKREKRVVTLLGECRFERNYYTCDCAEDDSRNKEESVMNEYVLPKDEKLGISGTKFTETVKHLTAQIASSDSFKDTSANLKMLCGIDVSAKECERIAEEIGEDIIAARQEEIAYSEAELNPPEPETPAEILYVEYDGTGVPIHKKELAGVKGKQADGSAKTREMKTGAIFTQSGLSDEGKPARDAGSATYFSQIGNLEDFGKLLYSEAVKRGVDYAGQVIIIGDGAKWIWNLANDYFPNATEIIDLYHAKEHVYDLLRTVTSNAAELHLQKAKLYKMLESGDIDGLTDAFTKLPAVTDEQLEKVRVECNYFTQNKKRMRYKDFSGQGLFVGSGVIEAACKNVIGKRLKQSGMMWSVSGANKIAALRCAVLTGIFEPKDTKTA